jgi:ankyrin repeat protein
MSKIAAMIALCDGVPPALLEAIARGDLDAADDRGKTVLMHLAVVDPDEATAAIRLAGMGALLAGGADLSVRDRQGFTALHWAAAHGSLAMIALLIAHGADPNARATALGCHALVLAHDRGAAITELLRAAGADPVAFTN